MRYGALPEDLGLIDLSPTEMMFWLYCPISLPHGSFVLPPNLEWTRPIVEAAWDCDPERCYAEHVYLTAKTLWVAGDYIGNRPGWHSDGFGTNDLNYIWYDRAPTEFYQGDFTLPDNCENAMQIMADIAFDADLILYPEKHLLRLDPSVIHRSPVGFEPGMRTFVKVSVSPDRYDLEGNSINHYLSASWPMAARKAERNHPASKANS